MARGKRIQLPRTLASAIEHRPIKYEPIMPTSQIARPGFGIVGVCPALLDPAARLSQARERLMALIPPRPDAWPVRITPHQVLNGDRVASIDCEWCFKSSMVEHPELVDWLNNHHGTLDGRLVPASEHDERSKT